MIMWTLSLVVTYLYPAIHSWCNPFLFPISSSISRRQNFVALWGALFSGIIRDVILSSPTLGICAMAQIFSALVGIRLTQSFSLEGWTGETTRIFSMCICDHVGSSAIAALYLGIHCAYTGLVSLPVTVACTLLCSFILMAIAHIHPKIHTLLWRSHGTDT